MEIAQRLHEDRAGTCRSGSPAVAFRPVAGYRLSVFPWDACRNRAKRSRGDARIYRIAAALIWPTCGQMQVRLGGWCQLGPQRRDAR
jgi:hypothetical protein